MKKKKTKWWQLKSLQIQMKGKNFIIIIINMNKSYNRLDSLKHLNYFLLWYSRVCVIWNSIFKHTRPQYKKKNKSDMLIKYAKKKFFFCTSFFLLMINSCPFMIRSTSSSLESNLSMFYFLFFLNVLREIIWRANKKKTLVLNFFLL